MHVVAGTFIMGDIVEAVRIVGMCPAWGLASPSPFCLKLETWLRIAGIPYAALSLNRPPQSASGKVPYLLLQDGAILADSNEIIAHLARAYGIDRSCGRTGADSARSHAALRLLEESLYFVAAWERWLLPACWTATRDAYFGTLPSGLRGLFASFMRRKMAAALHGQGMLRRAPAAIADHGVADLAALSGLLGAQPFFDGEQPGITDASAYGLLANVLRFPVRTPLQSALEARPDLVEFCRRIERTVWADRPAGLYSMENV